ncbi:VOC family protein, partial [Nocardia farcinica]|uniref:VOC family protein n=1 Tax=Nocardia farcinica TaxID=37329 RepID=UPI0024573415
RPPRATRATNLSHSPGPVPAPTPRPAPGSPHTAFWGRARRRVEQVHQRALALGSPILHPPRHFPEYPQPYYATFWLDPFGIMLEAVCHHDRD